MVGDSFNLGGRHQHAGAHVHGANLAGLYQSANRKNRYSQDRGCRAHTFATPRRLRGVPQLSFAVVLGQLGLDPLPQLSAFHTRSSFFIPFAGVGRGRRHRSAWPRAWQACGISGSANWSCVPLIRFITPCADWAIPSSLLSLRTWLAHSLHQPSVSSASRFAALMAFPRWMLASASFADSALSESSFLGSASLASSCRSHAGPGSRPRSCSASGRPRPSARPRARHQSGG